MLKPAAPQRPWELYRNMLPDVPQHKQGQNAPARSSLPAPPLQRPNLVAHGYKLGQKASPRRPKLAKGEICKDGSNVRSATSTHCVKGADCSRLVDALSGALIWGCRTIVFTPGRAKRQNELVNHFHQTLPYLPGSAAGCHSSTKPPVRNTSDAASRPLTITLTQPTRNIGVLDYLAPCAPSPVVPCPGDGSYSSTGLPDVYTATRNHLFFCV